MLDRFNNKVALVTGAASGIGRATALAFAAEGADVLLADINATGLEETAAEAESGSGRIAQFCFDASKREQCFALVEHCVTELGRLDVLCNIAGFPQCKHFIDFSEQDWQTMLAVNLSGVFYTCQAAIPELINSSGNIVNMASTAGLTGQAYQSSYCATKGGVVMLSKALAMEYVGRGVRVNAICPGAVQTPLMDKFKVPDDVDPKLMQRLFPLLEAAQPEEVARAILYLASEDARFVTGVAFPMDGAQTAG